MNSKLVISTQIRENYGAHDWDGVGTCPQNWRCKGGEVYVVPGLTAKDAHKIEKSGIPTLTSLIDVRNHGFEEFVVGWFIANDDDKVCEPWETPFSLFYESGKWVARRTVENGEYGYMNRSVASKTEQYVMLPNGERTEYSVVYHMRNGDKVTDEQVSTYLSKVA